MSASPASRIRLRLAERSAALDAAERALQQTGRERENPTPGQTTREPEHSAAAQEQTAELALRQEIAAQGRANPTRKQAVPAGRRNGRDPVSELRAERAMDAARFREVEAALRLADQVLSDAAASDIARARACEAKARALAFSGSDASVRRAERAFREAIDRYDALTTSQWGAVAHEWRGYALFGLAYVVHGLSGRLDEACSLMVASLEQLDPSSPRRPTVLAFYADALIALGDFERAEAVINEGIRLAAARDDRAAGPYMTWSRARIASQRGDAVETQRHLREAERDAGDWFETLTGTTFLAEAAELLDRVGRPEEARRYLARATERDTDDTFVRQAAAVLEARGGDPQLGIELLQEIAGDRFLEVATRWRLTLLLAWATLRLGGPEVGALAAQALDQAEDAGGVRVALAQEHDLVTALLPAAEAAGSVVARRLLAGESGAVVRLLGAGHVTSVIGPGHNASASDPAHTNGFADPAHVRGVMGSGRAIDVNEPAHSASANDSAPATDASGGAEVTGANGAARVAGSRSVRMPLPGGRARELLLLLAGSQAGVRTETVLERFFPDVAEEAARHRLRQLLTTIRSASGPLVEGPYVHHGQRRAGHRHRHADQRQHPRLPGHRRRPER